MSWLSQFVFDPVKALISSGLKSAEGDIAALAAKAAATYLPTPTPPPATQPEAVTALENALQTTVDGFVTATVGEAGPVGAALSPEAVTAANDVLDFGEQHALSVISALFVEAKNAIGDAVERVTA